MLVTTRDGRPVKIEGNPDHPLSSGSTCAVGQASILGLYDGQRLQYPTRRGQRSTWSDVDKEIADSSRSNPAAGRRRTTPDADDHQSDDGCAHRRVPRQLQERATRQLRCDLGVGRAGRPCADAWRPPAASLPLRSRGRHRLVRRRFPGHVDFTRGVHARLHQPAADRRALAVQVLPRPDRVAVVADRVERRSAFAGRAGRDRASRDASCRAPRAPRGNAV